jgi:Tfp pilus assembly ATPase PilU
MVAITLRLKKLNKFAALPAYEFLKPNKAWSEIDNQESVPKTTAGNPSNDPNEIIWIDPSRSDQNDFIARNFDIARILWQAIQGKKPTEKGADSPQIEKPASGLLVIAGATNSGKSELAKSIVGDYLQRRRLAERDKMLNLITLEDPIEAWLADATNENTIRSFYNLGVCYIPRQLHKDTDSLKSALKDSKRQSPECFYVGEIREKNDWKEAIEFASSGHLIVVTTHATNLRETIQRILNATESESPQRRKIVADALCAVIHARFIDYKLGDKKHKVQAPTFWVANSKSRNELVRDGLSSIIGNQSTCFNRQQLAIETLKRFSNSSGGMPPSPAMNIEDLNNILKEISKQDISEVIG